jgi:HPt (histidine-containing phosphotransfer) domain-containing protein
MIEDGNMERKYDLTLLKRLSNNDEVFIVDMLKTFRRTAVPTIERMERHIASGKYEALGREAHKFLPGVSFLGIKYLETDLMIIEENAKSGIDLEAMADLVVQVKTKVKDLIESFEQDFNLTQ